MSSERGNRLLRSADRWLGIPLTVPAACWRRLSRPGPYSDPPARIGIFCPGAVGDLLLLSTLTCGLRRKFPASHIEILATQANAGALPLNPHADAGSAWRLTSPGKLLAHIRAQKYDVFIDSSQWARLGNLLANLSAAKITAGFATRGQLRSAGFDFVCQHSASCHETENFLNLGRAIWPDLTGEPSLRLPPRHECGPGKIIYCHLWPAPGKGRVFKLWPQEHWASLISALLASGFGVRLTGSRDDAASCEAFIQQFFPGDQRVLSVAGSLPWPELAGCLACASAVVSVNTGVMHLAALSGAPTVGLHGATNPERWGPVGPRAISLLPEKGASAYLNLGFEHPKDTLPAMQHISVDSVLTALRKLDLSV